jgi:thiamine biosynthesis protein ThiI
MHPLYLLRLSGEITTTARGTRLVFLRRLHRNLEAALASTGLAGRVEREWARLYVEAPPAAALEVLPRVFGVQSLSAVERRPWARLEDVVDAGAELFAPLVAGRVFAVRARRGGDKRFVPFRSADVERALGGRLAPGAAGVDLTAPEVWARVEVREGTAYFFTEQIPGPGGLPLGTEGRALALLSGGFDSAVAAWQMLRRGVRLDYLFLELGGAAHRQGVLRVAKLLADRWSHGYRPRLHVVDFAPVVAALEAACEPRYWQVVLKRLMLRAANLVARRLRVDALVTGEAVGQVSSQTLRNLRVITEVAELPVLRPLVAANKDDIVAMAREIGTYELSAGVPEYCALAAKRPATHARRGDVLAEEARLDAGLVAAAVETARVVDLAALDPAELAPPELATTAVPPGAEVWDLRSPAAAGAWRYPGARHLEYFAALEGLAAFASDREHVLYCEVGIKSAHVAELLRARGVRASHLAGGLRQALALASAADPAHAALLSPVLRDRDG